MFDGAGWRILEASMTKNAEGAIADFAEDFAALRKDVGLCKFFSVNSERAIFRSL
jgi:hypothetical protein